MISTCWILKSIQIGLCICCEAADNSKICFVSNIFLRHITNQSNCSTLENYFNHYIFHSIEIATFRKKKGLSYSISSIKNIPSIEMQFQNMDSFPAKLFLVESYSKSLSMNTRTPSPDKFEIRIADDMENTLIRYQVNAHWREIDI